MTMRVCCKKIVSCGKTSYVSYCHVYFSSQRGGSSLFIVHIWRKNMITIIRMTLEGLC